MVSWVGGVGVNNLDDRVELSAGKTQTNSCCKPFLRKQVTEELKYLEYDVAGDIYVTTFVQYSLVYTD
jgi:hypothetical protein